MNGAVHSLCQILKFVAASAAEAELGALYLNVKQGRIIRLALEEMGHPQPPTPINCDNLTTTGIVNGTVKRQITKSKQRGSTNGRSTTSLASIRLKTTYRMTPKVTLRPSPQEKMCKNNNLNQGQFELLKNKQQ